MAKGGFTGLTLGGFTGRHPYAGQTRLRLGGFTG